MRKFIVISLFLIPFLTVPLFAAGDVEIDVSAILAAAEAIFLAGVGGMSVTALVSVIKRWLNAQDGWVIAISIVVSVGAVLAYLIPIGFVWWKFIVYTAIVALAANGIYLFPHKRSEKKRI